MDLALVSVALSNIEPKKEGLLKDRVLGLLPKAFDGRPLIDQIGHMSMERLLKEPGPELVF